MKDKAVAGRRMACAADLIPLPKRRGGCIWTKRPTRCMRSWTWRGGDHHRNAAGDPRSQQRSDVCDRSGEVT